MVVIHSFIIDKIYRTYNVMNFPFQNVGDIIESIVIFIDHF